MRNNQLVHENRAESSSYLLGIKPLGKEASVFSPNNYFIKQQLCLQGLRYKHCILNGQDAQAKEHIENAKKLRYNLHKEQKEINNFIDEEISYLLS